MSPAAAGAAGVGVLLLLIFLRMPIGFAMALVGFLGMTCLADVNRALFSLSMIPFHSTASFTLTTVPLFILMGQFAYRSGMSEEIFAAAQKWLGHFPGGLAMATMGACGVFAAAMGSSTAEAASMGVISIDSMRRRGYAPGFAAATVAVGGTLGVLIPPSLTFIIYGAITEESIGKLFMAGIIPGIIAIMLYILAIYTMVKRNPRLSAPVAAVGWRERIISLKPVWSFAALVLIVLGGIYSGFSTAIEAGAVGAFGAFLLALYKKRVTRSSLLDALMATGKTTGLIYTIIIGAMILNRFLAMSNLPSQLALLLKEMAVPPMATLAVIMVLYLLLGMFMDALPMMLLTLPIIFPVILASGFDPIWFGVLIVILVEIGLVTPPVGMNVFVIGGLFPDVPMWDIFRATYSYYPFMLLLLAIVIIFPELSLFLPRMMIG